MKKSNFNEYKIKLGQVTNNVNQIITLALDDYLRKKLKTREYNALDDNDYTNHLIGETINANRGVFGYDPDLNDIPDDKKYLLIKETYDDYMD
jgi:hypothetical protein